MSTSPIPGAAAAIAAALQKGEAAGLPPLEFCVELNGPNVTVHAEPDDPADALRWALHLGLSPAPEKNRHGDYTGVIVLLGSYSDVNWRLRYVPQDGRVDWASAIQQTVTLPPVGVSA